MRRLRVVARAGIVCTLGALTVAFGGGCGGAGEAAARAALVVGELELALTLGIDGVVPLAASGTTALGVRLDVAAGTVVRTPRGEALSGDVVLRLDDGGGDAAWLGAQTGPLDGAWRVQVFLIDGAARLPVDAVFDPPLVLDLSPVLADDFSGSFTLEPFVAVAGPPPASLPPPAPPVGGEPPSGTSYLRYERVQIGGPSEIVSIPVSSLTGARLDDPSIPPAGSVFVGDTIYEEVLGPVGTDFPRVCCVEIITPDTFQKVNVGCWPPGLFLPGQARFMKYLSTPPNFLVEVVEVAGERRLRIRSPYKNAFTVRTTRYEAAGADGVAVSTPVAGSPAEADQGALYLGFMTVVIRSCGGFREFLAACDTVAAALGADDDLQVSRFRSPDGSYVGIATVSHHQESVRTLAGNLPPGWTFVFGNRILGIDIPWPPPPIVITSYGADLVVPVDPFTFTLGAPVGPLPGAPDDVAVTPGGVVFVSTVDPPGVDPGLLVRIAPGGVVGAPVAVAGLSSGIALDPVGRALYAATADGAFHAFDPLTFAPQWSLGGLGAAPTHHDVVVRQDGAFAYVVSGGGLLSEIDLLRRSIRRSIPLPTPGTPAVSDDGAFLAVTAAPLDGVHGIDLTGPGVPVFLPAGDQPAHPIFTPGTRDLFVASVLDGQLRQIPGSGAPAVSALSAGPGLQSLACFVPAPGALPVLLGAHVAANQLFHGVLGSPAVPVPWVPSPAPAQPTLVRVGGR